MGVVCILMSCGLFEELEKLSVYRRPVAGLFRVLAYCGLNLYVEWGALTFISW